MRALWTYITTSEAPKHTCGSPTTISGLACSGQKEVWWSTQVCIPNPWYVNSDNVVCSGVHRLGHVELLVAAHVGRDLVSFTEAMESVDSKQWSNACQYEIDALQKNNTWELINLPPSCKSIKSKWVFKWKSDGCYHVHLVAKGFMQIPGIDYDETFSPVALSSFTSFRSAV